MTDNLNKPEVIQYRTSGTCCQMMYVAVQDGYIIDAEFLGGCNGNLKAIKALIKGAKIEEVINRLSGIKCGDKDTSCPDQLAKCLSEYLLSKKSAEQKTV